MLLDHTQTMQLIVAAQKGDNNACEKLLTENTPLLKSIIKRYLGKHVDYEDLFQIASIGLLKAIKNFSTEYNVRFTTYAVPMVLGEIKRYMRDDGYVKVSRSTKSIATKINKYVEEYTKQTGKAPTVTEIASNFKMDVSETVFAMESSKMPISLYDTISDKDGKPTELIERISTEDDQKMLKMILLKDSLRQLAPRARKIIILRFFRDLTQLETAQKMGVSQVQISRIEAKAIADLRKLYQLEETTSKPKK